MFGDREARLKRKIRRIGKTSAYSVGGGVAMLGLALFYPRPQEAERVAHLFMPLGYLLIAYGLTMLFMIMVRQPLAPLVNFLFMAFVIPACLFYIFSANFHG